MPSGLFKLNTRDFAKGLVMAVLGALFAYLSTALGAETLSIDWNYLLKIALTTGMAYLSKNMMTDSDGKLMGKI